MDITSSFLLGCVTSVFAGSKNRVAKLDPLVDFGPEGRVTARRIAREERRELFPNTGRVAWFGAPDDVFENSLWCFQVSETPTFDVSKPTHDQMATDGDPVPAIEVIDARKIGDANQLREILSGRGLALSFTPCPRVYLWVTETLWVGPIHLNPSGDEAHRWLIDPVALHKLVPTVVSLPDAVSKATVEGVDRLFLAPRARPRQTMGLDWSPDEEALKRILRWVAKRSPEFDGQLRLTRAIVDHATGVVLRREMGSPEADLNGDRLERARRLVERVGQREDLADAIVDSLVRLPRFQQELGERVDERVEAAIAEALRDLAGRIADGDQHVARAAARLEELGAERERLEAEISGYEEMRADDERRLAAARADVEQELAELATRRASAEQDLADHFRALIAELPAKLLAQVAVLRLLAGVGAATDRGEAQVGPPTPTGHGAELDSSAAGESEGISPRLLPPMAQSAPVAALAADDAQSGGWLTRRCSPWDVGPPHISLVSEFTDARRILRAASARARFAQKGALALHVALMSDAMPVVAGPRTLDFLESYADALCGGRVLWLPVSPTTVAPTDLFGHVDTHNGALRPTSSLLDTLREAVGHDEMLLVVLDGVNRAPVDMYLTPLLECYRTRHRGRRARELPLCHGPSAHEAGRGERSVAWPRNVLLAGTWASGPAALPPSAAFWEYAVLISLENYPAPPDVVPAAHPDSEAQEAVAVTIATWNTWRHDVCRYDAAAVREMLGHLNGLPGGADPTAELLFGAAMHWYGVQEDTACAEVIGARLIPAAAAAGVLAQLQQALGAQGRWNDELDLLAASAAKLVG